MIGDGTLDLHRPCSVGKRASPASAHSVIYQPITIEKTRKHSTEPVVGA